MTTATTPAAVRESQLCRYGVEVYRLDAWLIVIVAVPGGWSAVARDAAGEAHGGKRRFKSADDALNATTGWIEQQEVGR